MENKDELITEDGIEDAFEVHLQFNSLIILFVYQSFNVILHIVYYIDGLLYHFCSLFTSFFGFLCPTALSKPNFTGISMYLKKEHNNPIWL